MKDGIIMTPRPLNPFSGYLWPRTLNQGRDIDPFLDLKSDALTFVPTYSLSFLGFHDAHHFSRCQRSFLLPCNTWASDHNIRFGGFKLNEIIQDRKAMRGWIPPVNVEQLMSLVLDPNGGCNALVDAARTSSFCTSYSAQTTFL